jgi:hypothetical protein
VGGCNGCVAVNLPGNKGLKDIVDLLQWAYTVNGFRRFGASLADFFALAATTAVTLGVQESFFMNLHFGRKLFVKIISKNRYFSLCIRLLGQNMGS